MSNPSQTSSDNTDFPRVSVKTREQAVENIQKSFFSWLESSKNHQIYDKVDEESIDIFVRWLFDNPQAVSNHAEIFALSDMIRAWKEAKADLGTACVIALNLHDKASYASNDLNTVLALVKTLYEMESRSKVR